MANNLHIKNLLLWKQDVLAKETDVYATWRTKESGMTTCQVDRWSVKGCKDAEIESWPSAATNWEQWRTLLKESKNLYELWCLLLLLFIYLLLLLLLILLLGFCPHSFKCNQFLKMLYVPCNFLI
jgi:hypothetical protein